MSLARILLSGFALIAWAGAGAVSARADEINLIFPTGLPPTMHMSQSVLHPWADRINAQGKGIVHVDIRDGMALATPANSYERVLDDAIQIGWGSQVYIAGKFIRTGAISLPAMLPNAEIGSVAFWRLYKSGLVDAEYDEVMPLILVAFSQDDIHTAKPFTPIDSLAGLKIVGTSKVLAQIVTLLGGTPISLQTTEIYEGMQRHTVDGVLTSYAVFPAFKLDEVAFYHVESRLGGAPGMVFMSRKKYQSLPEAARKIIDANATEKETHDFGAFSDRDAEAERRLLLASPQHKIVTPTAAQEKKIEDKLQPIIAQWEASVPDGAKIVAVLKKDVADVKAGR